MHHTLFILDYFPPKIGGAETLFDNVTQFCSKKNMRITVLTSRYDPLLKRIEKKGDVTIYRIGSTRRGLFWRSIVFVLKNKELIQSTSHIHTSTYAAGLSAWCIGKIRKKSTSITIHELYDNLWYHIKGKKGRMYIRYEWLICHLSWTAIITPSKTSMTTIKNLYPKLTSPISTILNTIDKKFWSPDSINKQDQEIVRKKYNILQSEKLLLFIGRLGLEKGLIYLVEAFSELTKDHPDAKLVIVAPRTASYYNKSTQHQIQQLNNYIGNSFLHDHIIWIDPVSDEEIKLWMSISHFGVVPSMSEGFCRTAVQMQAMGLHLLASEVGALPEVLDPNTTIFVPYGKVADLREAIREILSQQDVFKSKNKIIHEVAQEPATTDEDYYMLFMNSLSSDNNH